MFSFPGACKVAEIHRDKDHRRDNNQAGGEDKSKAKQINQSMVIHSTDTRERNAGRPGMRSEVTAGAHGTTSKGSEFGGTSHTRSLGRLQHTLWF